MLEISEREIEILRRMVFSRRVVWECTDFIASPSADSNHADYRKTLKALHSLANKDLVACRNFYSTNQTVWYLDFSDEKGTSWNRQSK